MRIYRPKEVAKSSDLEWCRLSDVRQYIVELERDIIDRIEKQFCLTALRLDKIQLNDKRRKK